MKKILVMTYCTWTSIGSMLQALGLRKALLENNYDSVIWLQKGENDFQTIKINSVKRFLIRIHQLVIRKRRLSAFKKRNNFINENLNIEYIEFENEYKKRVNKESFECVLAGSDQIWNPINMNPLFFLDFVENRKKISYAASMGSTAIDNKIKNQFKNYLKEFDFISVRELECKEILQPLTDNCIEVNIDPVFLCGVDEWRTYEIPYPIKKPYILLYMLYWDEECKGKIKELKKKTGLQVIAISNQLSRVYADQILYDVGPGEFLWLIDHAEYVVSSSFHGVAFATMFNKRFSAVVNPVSPSRIQHLMRMLEIPKIEIEELDRINTFNYKNTNYLIEMEREKSRKYLEKVLNNEHIKI